MIGVVVATCLSNVQDAHLGVMRLGANPIIVGQQVAYAAVEVRGSAFFEIFEVGLQIAVGCKVLHHRQEQQSALALCESDLGHGERSNGAAHIA